MEQDNRNGSGLGFASGLIIGGLIGAVVAIVLAPQSGEETRDLIRGKAHEFKGKAMDLASDLRDRAIRSGGRPPLASRRPQQTWPGYLRQRAHTVQRRRREREKSRSCQASRTRDRLGVRS